ncbi:MAG: maltose alpha-D-glucosyltransferase [Dehalococcoidia bacterium]
MPTKRATRKSRPGVGTDPLWYKDAIIYELHVRAFQDGDADGMGDFRGLTQKLDYLRDLGVTAIWLLPFYASPLRDDGYDIADFKTIHPGYGTLRDFQTFLAEAHARGLRVITELVLNHTSDQHPWFQRARNAPKGHPWRDYYVWSDTAAEYSSARIIFKDFERSNWTWDPVANQYFWHRFYSHQPDLNYDNPAVRRDVLKVVDFWLNMGVDGFRLDAVPYLFEREGTSCENLPETHDFLKELRHHVDTKFPGRMLLAEANQWPEDAAAYFGDGDECHMAYHFPLMPRLFMAVRMEDRFPVTEILDQTPAIDDTSQWAIFLRNHDELTLEMVTDEERDYMYRVYAGEERARINLGIRRRLAPLLGHNRRVIELMYALLFSMRGTPVIYYGDEIGMGDNIYLGDRDSVRTPMQWSSERNAGFSSANPQQLYLPVVTDPEYHYESVNVEAQQANPSLLLWWMRRVIALRRNHQAFSRGAMTFVDSDNRRVLAFVREFEGERVLVVANLSRFTQGVSLNLQEYAGTIPVELFGRAHFPTIGEAPYFMSLGPHTFFWFELEPLATHDRSPAMYPLALSDGEEWTVFFDGRRQQLERALTAYLPGRRWFGSKSRRIKRLAIDDVLPLGRRAPLPTSFVMLTVEYDEGEAENFGLLLSAVPEDRALLLETSVPWAAVAPIHRENQPNLHLIDGFAVPEVASAFLDLLRNRVTLAGSKGSLECTSKPVVRAVGGELAPSVQRNEQSNTSVSYGDRFMLKFIRRVEAGLHPQIEIEDFLAASNVSGNIPELLGTALYKRRGVKPAAVAILENHIQHQSDGWLLAVDELTRFLEGVASAVIEPPELAPERHPMDMPEPDPLLVEKTGPWFEQVASLGRRTGQLHAALAHSKHADFAPEPYTPFYQRALAQGFRVQARHSLRMLRSAMKTLSQDAAQHASRVLSLEPELLARLHEVAGHRLKGMRIRNHGDLHLGQVLSNGSDWVFIDFEGEPSRSLGDRRIKRSAMRDVAGMVRSFYYASQFSTREAAMAVQGAGGEHLREWARAWYLWSASAYLRAYFEEIAGAGIITDDPEETRFLLDTFMLDKALYELAYELDNRPTWVDIPLRSILDLLNASPVNGGEASP